MTVGRHSEMMKLVTRYTLLGKGFGAIAERRDSESRAPRSTRMLRRSESCAPALTAGAASD